jgi:AcrR family transcriptional regulator
MTTETKAGATGVSRVERKKRETRQNIVGAAQRLMNTRPVDEVTIQDITEEADVGHGTFYLHFKSKYEVLVPIVQARAAYWDAQVQSQLGDLQDPAEIFAFTARHMARVVLNEPLWRWFLAHSGVPIEDMRAAVGAFGARDVRRGFASGRFNVPDLRISTSFMFGAYVNSLLACLDLDEPEPALNQVVEMMLRVLGLSASEAQTIANAPLPPLESH